ncbi:AAA family ATPase [Fusobacterium mortiferum]|uniref:AAA family ATPase n=1 Tax=Fusobacterium mortiferum TaxID=850 RepID=UPI00158C17A7|nr:hypothetical protein [Fusobacterium mortiferum]
MFIIKKLKIDIIDENNKSWGRELEFKEGLNVIIGKNDIGKSTIVNSIYYVLGMEELLGYRDSRALKPVLRSFIVTDKGNGGENKVKVKESFIFLEIENLKGETITLRRAAKSQEISEKLITVYFGKLNNISSLKSSDYFLNQNSVISPQGFYNFFEKFLSLNLPLVSSFDNTKEGVKLYIQNIFSAFFIEQVSGWSDLMANIPGYYKIIHPRRRTIEYILKLDYYKILMKKNEYMLMKKKLLSDFNEMFLKINSVKRNTFIVIEGMEKDYSKFDKKDIKLLIQKNDNDIITLTEYLDKKNRELNELKSSEYFSNESNDVVNELQEKIEEVQSALIINQKFYRDSQEELSTLESQNKYLNKEKNNIELEIRNFKDIEKLKKLGSKKEINFEECPYCNRKLPEILYSTSLEIMSTEENIKYLKEKNKIFTMALNINIHSIEKIKLQIEKIEKDMKDLFKELNILNRDLPRISLQKALINKEIHLNNELELLKEVKLELEEIFNELGDIVSLIKKYDKQLEELPKDNFSEEDKETLNKFEKDFLEIFNFLKDYNSNNEEIRISRETYFPEVSNFNVKLHISASDFIRLQWAYYISLIKNSFFDKNILIFDEPAQQNIEIDSIKKLFNILNSLPKVQAIVSYAIDDSLIENVINFFKEKNIKYFHINGASIVEV